MKQHSCQGRKVLQNLNVLTREDVYGVHAKAEEVDPGRALDLCTRSWEQIDRCWRGEEESFLAPALLLSMAKIHLKDHVWPQIVKSI